MSERAAPLLSSCTDQTYAHEADAPMGSYLLQDEIVESGQRSTNSVGVKSDFVDSDDCKRESFIDGLTHEGMGAKHIGYVAGTMLLMNNITGPGLPSLSNLFVEAGWLPVVLCILVIWLMTTFAATMYAEAMENIPGNKGFQSRAEYTAVRGTSGRHRGKAEVLTISPSLE